MLVGTPDVAVGRAIAESLSEAALSLGYAAVTLCIVYCGLCLHRTLMSEI